MELESAIQELLSRLEFVSLPGLGSFVKRYEPASPSADGKSFNPPREFYIFDTKRVFNDEALENFLVEKYGLEHKKAADNVGKFVEGIKNKLESATDVIFPGVGCLRKNSLGDIDLIPADEIVSQTYGLGRVEAPQKSAEKIKVEVVTPRVKVEPTPPVKQEINTSPAPKTTSKKGIIIPVLVVFALVAVVAVFVLVHELRFWEESGMVVQNEVADSNAVAKTDVFSADSVELSDSAVHASELQVDEIDAESQPEKQPVVAITDKKVALYYKETSKDENKTFYIVAGSFAQENNAQKLIEDLSKKGYKPMLIQNNNMYRVAIYKFTNRDRALRELERLKSQKVSDKVWLLSI